MLLVTTILQFAVCGYHGSVKNEDLMPAELNNAISALLLLLIEYLSTALILST